MNRKHQHGFFSDSDYSRLTSPLMKEIEKEEKKGILSPEDQIYGFMSLDGDYLEVDEVFPLKPYKFEGYSFWGPNRFHDFLTRCYGDFMALPPEDKRVPHYSSVTFIDHD